MSILLQTNVHVHVHTRIIIIHVLVYQVNCQENNCHVSSTSTDCISVRVLSPMV